MLGISMFQFANIAKNINFYITLYIFFKGVAATSVLRPIRPIHWGIHVRESMRTELFHPLL